MSSSAGVESKRVVAGILAILLGAIGVHKFYLGMTTPGLIQLVLGICTGGMTGIIGLIEGIIYLTKTDEEFIRLYQSENPKEWF